jgi:hypothetical protein
MRPGKGAKFPKNLRPISLFSTTGNLFEEVILKILQRHIEERGVLNVMQFGFRALHGMTLQRMRYKEHVTLNFNNNTYTAAAFLDIKKASDTTWHPGLLYKLSILNFSLSLIKLISPFLSQRKFSLRRRRNVYANQKPRAVARKKDEIDQLLVYSSEEIQFAEAREDRHYSIIDECK